VVGDGLGDGEGEAEGDGDGDGEITTAVVWFGIRAHPDVSKSSARTTGAPNHLPLTASERTKRSGESRGAGS
jgi:hypothetical protein